MLGAYLAEAPLSILIDKNGTQNTLFMMGIAGIAGWVCGVTISSVTLAIIFGQGGMPRIGILGWPIGCLLIAGVLRRGAIDLAKRRPIRWGGREYVIEPGP